MEYVCREFFEEGERLFFAPCVDETAQEHIARAVGLEIGHGNDVGKFRMQEVIVTRSFG